MQIIPDPRVLLVQAVGFLLVLAVFKVYLFKPIMSILDARRGEIDDQYSDAEATRKTAEELRANYEQHLAAVDEEMRAKIAEALKEGQAMRDEIIADSRAKADSILTKAQDEIQREKEKALVELKTTVVDFTVNAAGKLIEANLDTDKNRKLVREFIGSLEEVAK